MFSKPIGEGVELLLLEERHCEEIVEVVLRNREHIRQWMGWLADDYSVETARAWRRKALELFARGEGLAAGIVKDGRIIGTIGMHAVDHANRRTSMGYWLDAAHQGRGIVTAAARAVVSYALQDLKLNRVQINCAPGNARSRGIPQRLGFKEEGVIRDAEWLYDHYVDHVVYGMLAREWVG